MKTLFLLFITLGMFTTNGCEENELAQLFGLTFMYSYEDNREEIKAYRPHTYKFPPSRGRSGFRFEEDGTFVSLDIAPTDGIESRSGTWKLTGKEPLQIEVQLPARTSVPGSKPQTLHWEVVEFQASDSLLLIRPVEK